MTDQELRNLVAETGKQIAAFSAETSKRIAELAAEANRRSAKFDEQLAESSAEAKRRSARLDEQLAESSAEAKRRSANIDKQLAETGRFIKEVGRQLGKLGNAQGRYTEGLVYPSLERILRERFKMDVVVQRALSRKNGAALELDVFAYSNTGIDEVYVAEIKSSYGEAEFQQTLKTLETFPKFFPTHAGKKLYGIVAAVDIAENMRNRVLGAGLYLARIGDETVKLQVPRGFKAKAFNNVGNGKPKRSE